MASEGPVTRSRTKRSQQAIAPEDDEKTAKAVKLASLPPLSLDIPWTMKKALAFKRAFTDERDVCTERALASAYWDAISNRTAEAQIQVFKLVELKRNVRRLRSLSYAAYAADDQRLVIEFNKVIPPEEFVEKTEEEEEEGEVEDWYINRKNSVLV